MSRLEVLLNLIGVMIGKMLDPLISDVGCYTPNSGKGGAECSQLGMTEVET